MRITIAHNKGKQQAIAAVDHAIDDAFKGLAIGPIQVTDPQKTWNDNVMTFALVAKMGFLKNPVSGTVEVTDHDVTIDADLGMFHNLIPEERVRTTLETRVRGLLS